MREPLLSDPSATAGVPPLAAAGAEQVRMDRVAPVRVRWRRMASDPRSSPLTLPVASLALLLAAGAYGRAQPIALALTATAIVVAVLGSVLTAHQARTSAKRHGPSLTDHLSGLPSRRAFLAALGDATARPGGQQARFAFLLLDLDGFRELNDTLGHPAGDVVLKRVAARLSRLGGGPALFARLGADEFAALVPRPPERPGADRPLELAARALRAIRRPLAIEGIEIVPSASVGIALHPEHACNGRELMRLAGVAMRQAKRQRLSVALYRSGMDPHSRERLAVLAQLRQALKREELAVQYQPQLDLRSGRVSGLEALVRWRRPDGTVVSPHEFLPVAERYGLMRDVTSQVLRSVVAQQAQWLREGLCCPVAINLSPSDLQDHDLASRIASVLGRTGVPAELLQVEVTEHLLMSDPDGANAVLEQLRAMGVRVALDDFGTGHSSLAYVQRLALDELKIDRRFVSGMRDSEGDAAIVRLAIELGHAFGLEVVAEGVEDRRAVRALLALGCDVIQGHWLGRPMWADDVPEWMACCAPDRLRPAS
jgi:diguanylate cyclase (GGDEF)-like protein